jgi:Fe2+ or Zn2+ uptake regulation protein
MTIQEAVQSSVAMQVMFYDGDGMCAGILHGKHIICACCGGVFEVDEVIDNARADGKNAIEMFGTWVDVSDEIKGDCENGIVLEIEEDC